MRGHGLTPARPPRHGWRPPASGARRIRCRRMRRRTLRGHRGGRRRHRGRATISTAKGVWDFVRTHLKQLPVFVAKDGQAEIIAERQNYLLFDRMVAFYVQRGIAVPLSAAEFYQGLAQRFSEREGMYFLPEQVAEYDKRRMT